MRAAGFVLAAALIAPAQAAEFNAALTVAPEVDTPNQASPYPVAGLPSRGSRQELELRLREGGLNGQGTLRWQAVEGRKPERHWVANQLYYDGDAGDGIGWTVGKKVVSWGVGFGFRPLDVVQREDRRGVNPPALVGVPLLAVERFTADEAWTWVWTRPGEGGGDKDNRDSALALHWYRLAGGDDLHGVARLSHRRGVEAGAGFTRVVGEEWSFHAEALYQKRGLVRPNGSFDGEGAKAVAGMQWTGESGVSFLAEAWHDADAPLATRTPQGNVLARVAYDDRDGFKPYAEWLATPRDGGRVLTLGASWEGNRQRVSFGLRQLGGAADSAYARAPVKRLAWVEWRLAMF